MKMFNFDSDENAEDIDVPSIKTADMCRRHHRCVVETDDDIDPFQW